MADVDDELWTFGRWPDSVDRRWLAAESTHMHLAYWREADPEEFRP